MNSFVNHTTGAAGRPGQIGLREALGPSFGMVAPSEATLAAAFGRTVRPRPERPIRH